MRTHRNLTLDGVIDEDSGAVFENLKVIACTFDNCEFSYTTKLKRRSIVRNVTLTECSAISSSIGPAILEDVTIDSLAVGDILLIWGSVFKHVTLKGKIGAVKINKTADRIKRRPSIEASFAKARTQYYRTVDWALDISKALTTEFDVRGIPAHLIRRDPETQIVVTREKALQLDWRARVSSWNEDGVYLVDRFLTDGDDDCVLIAPKGSKRRFKRVRDALNDLRRAGVAEPS